MGSSMAENHPVGFRWVIKAREKGATVIHVDPRFTRTSAMADMWAPIRAGSDIVFLGAMVNYVLANDLDFREYIVPYTNAATIISRDFRDTEELDGLFSGWDPSTRTYAAETWAYEADEHAGLETAQEDVRGGHGKDRGDDTSKVEQPHRDPTLQHPRCVFQILKRHYTRYTPEMVEQVCGVPRDAFLRIADAFCRASGPERTGAICYAVGWTQHSTGVQIIRTAAILQLLLGNIGRPGGGILALRGHASIQGSTDIPTLYDILPGYIPMPAFGPDSASLADYLRKHRSNAGWWAHLDAFVVSLLKAWYGDKATAENDYGFGWLPRISGDHSRFRLLAQHGRYALTDTYWRRPPRGCSRRHAHRRSVRDGTEPRGGCAQCAARAAGYGESQMARRPRSGRDRDRDVLARLPGNTARGTADRRHRHRGVLLSGGRTCGKGRLLHEHPAAPAVAREGGGGACGRTQRGVVPLPARAAAQGTRRARFAPAQRRPSRIDMGLSGRRQSR